MKELDRYLLAVLDGLRGLAELIECDTNLIEVLSNPLALALPEIQWLGPVE